MNTMNTHIKRLLALVLAVIIGVTFMPPLALEAFADTEEELDISLLDESKTTFLEGEKIKVKISGDAYDSWVAIYGKGDKRDPNAGGEYSFCWISVSDYTGKTVDLSNPMFNHNTPRGSLVPGEYEIILFADGGYDNVKKVIPITIVADPSRPADTPSDQLTLQLEDPTKTTYKIGEPIYMRTTGTAKGAWVGLYETDAILKDPAAGGTRPYRWFYIKEYNGKRVDLSTSEVDPSFRGNLPEGTYDLILFGDDGYENIIKKVPFAIEGTIDFDDATYQIAVEKKEYKYGDDIRVMAKGTGINDGAWVGLYYESTTEYKESYFYAYYVRDYEGIYTVIQDKSTLEHTMPVLEPGDYKLVLFGDDTYDLPIKSASFTIVREVKYVKPLREPGCGKYGMEYVTYVDGYQEYREVAALEHIWGPLTYVEGTKTHEQKCNREGCGHVRTFDCNLVNARVETQAITTTTGLRAYDCSECGGVYTEEIPKMAAAPTLEQTTFVYTGKNIKPAFGKFYDENGVEIADMFYKISYPSSCKNVGTYQATVSFIGDYGKTYKLSYTIKPKAVSLKTLTKGKKSIKVTWKKAAGQTTGYRIAYSTNANFKNVKYVKVNGINKASATLKNLKANKKYYVKIRAYKTVGGKTYYSDWSKVKSVTTMKSK